MFLRTHVSASILGSTKMYVKVKNLIKVIDELFVQYDKYLASTLII